MDIAGRFIFGRYSANDSPLHRIDPRVKLFFIFLLSLALFISEKIDGYILPVLFLFIAIPVSKIGFKRLILGIIPILWIVSFTFILNYFTVGFDIAFFLSLRIILLFGWASLLTATTRAEDIGRALSWYLSPLKIFKISVEKLSLVFTMSLRFFPLVLDEAESIIRAQKLKRDKNTPVEKLISFCTVFMIRILNRADSIETALSNRGLIDREIALNPSVRGSWGSTLAVGILSLCILFLAV